VGGLSEGGAGRQDAILGGTDLISVG